jgi:hypothetical protein
MEVVFSTIPIPEPFIVQGYTQNGNWRDSSAVLPSAKSKCHPAMAAAIDETTTCANPAYPGTVDFDSNLVASSLIRIWTYGLHAGPNEKFPRFVLRIGTSVGNNKGDGQGVRPRVQLAFGRDTDGNRNDV